MGGMGNLVWERKCESATLEQDLGAMAGVVWLSNTFGSLDLSAFCFRSLSMLSGVSKPLGNDFQNFWLLTNEAGQPKEGKVCQ